MLTFRSINSCFPPFYLLALKDVAYHLWRGPDDLDVLPFVGQHPPPGHDDQEISDVGDIRDAPQGVVHHYFLEEEKGLRLVGGKRERPLSLFTFRSVLSTMIFSVEMKRSTSVEGWFSPSGACTKGEPSHENYFPTIPKQKKQMKLWHITKKKGARFFVLTKA